MSDSLLPYYNRELDALRRLAGEFAEAHPKVAGRLRLTADKVDDPLVERLLEGVAFLSARAKRARAGAGFFSGARRSRTSGLTSRTAALKSSASSSATRFTLPPTALF